MSQPLPDLKLPTKINIQSHTEKDMNLPVDSIRDEACTHARAAIDMAVVEEYAERMKAGDTFPRVIVYRETDRGEIWMADGFHRLQAARTAHLKTLAATVRRGTKRDALLYSLGANAQHGLRRTNADKRRAVTLMLQDPEWGKWSDQEIARRCAVSAAFVGNVRGASINGLEIGDRKVERDGKTYEMRTAKIGKLRGLINAPDPLAAQRELFPAPEGQAGPAPAPHYDPHPDAAPEDEAYEETVRQETGRHVLPEQYKRFCPVCDSALWLDRPAKIMRAVAKERKP